MKITVGTRNPVKVAAVTELLKEYPHLADAEVTGIDVPSEVSDQPRSLEEVTSGAVNRAKNAFSDCSYSIGMEAGFVSVPHSKSGYLNLTAAAVYDGTNVHLGLSSAFETPDPEIMRLVVEGGMAFDQAANATGFTDDPNIGKAGGIIGTLTKGQVDRKKYVQEALRMALIHIDQ